MYTLKSYDELEFSDDFLFSMIMQNESICKKVLKTLLGFEIEKIDYINRQQDIHPDYSSQGVRLDVFVKEENKIYNIEMQATDKPELPKRARYYQSLIDLYSMQKIKTENGETVSLKKQYLHLQESYVIFICKKDPFGFGIPVYSNKQICAELPEANEKMNDKTHRVFYNASAWKKCADKDLRAFLKYVAESESESDLTDEINAEVSSSKYNELWRNRFMTDIDMAAEWAEEWALDLAEEKVKTILQEKLDTLVQDFAQQKQLETAKNFLKMGLTVEQIAQGTGLSIEQVSELNK